MHVETDFHHECAIKRQTFMLDQTDDCQKSRVLQISWSHNEGMIKTSNGFCDDESCKCDCHTGTSFRRGNKKRQYC